MIPKNWTFSVMNSRYHGVNLKSVAMDSDYKKDNEEDGHVLVISITYAL